MGDLDKTRVLLWRGEGKQSNTYSLLVGRGFEQDFVKYDECVVFKTLLFFLFGFQVKTN